MKILAVGAHPDDVEFTCSGTLSLLKKAGHEIAIMTVCNGSGGSAVWKTDDIVRIRRAECIRAADYLEAEYFCPDIPDLGVFMCEDHLRRVTEILRKVQPDIIFAPSMEDYMCDHEVAGRLTRDATFCASLPNFATLARDPAPICTKQPHLYYERPLEGKDCYGQPVPFTCVVNVDGELDLKKNMLVCHASQRDWLREHHGVDQYVISMEEWTKEMGEAGGFAWGETFRQHLGHAYPHNNILKELLGERVKDV